MFWRAVLWRTDARCLRNRGTMQDYQLKHAIASGAVGFKLDEDDVDVSVRVNPLPTTDH